MRQVVLTDGQVNMRTSNNFKTSGIFGESFNDQKVSQKNNRLENKTFQSNVFNQKVENIQKNERSNNNMKGNDIFNAGQNSMLSQTGIKDKEIKVRVNQNHEGNHIFNNNGNTQPETRPRTTKTIQDSNIFGVDKSQGTTYQTNQTQQRVRLNNNHTNNILSTEEHQNPCAGMYHTKKKVLQPDFEQIDPKVKRQMELYGTDIVNTVEKEVKVKNEFNPKEKRINEVQCSDIFNQNKNYSQISVKQSNNTQSNNNPVKKLTKNQAFAASQINLHKSVVFGDKQDIQTEIKVKFVKDDNDNIDKRKNNHLYSNLFGNEYVGQNLNKKKQTTESTNNDWKLQNQEIYMTQEEKEIHKKEFEELDCKQKKYRELTSHLNNIGDLKNSVIIEKDEKFEDKFDELEKVEFIVEKGGKQETTNLKKQLLSHHQIHGDYTTQKEKEIVQSKIYEFNVQKIPEGYDEFSFKRFCSTNGIQCVKFDVQFNHLNNKLQGDALLQLRCKNDEQSKLVAQKLKDQGFNVETYVPKSKNVPQQCTQTVKNLNVHRQLYNKKPQSAKTSFIKSNKK